MRRPCTLKNSAGIDFALISKSVSYQIQNIENFMNCEGVIESTLNSRNIHLIARNGGIRLTVRDQILPQVLAIRIQSAMAGRRFDFF